MQIEPYYPSLPNKAQPQPLPLTYYTMPGYEENELNLRQILGVLRRRVLVIAGVAVAVTGAIWAWTFTRVPIYQSGFQVLVEPVTNLSRSADLSTVLFGLQSSFDYATQIEVLRSPELLTPVVSNLRKTYPDVSYGELVSNLKITQVQDLDGRSTKILLISYKDRDPRKVKAVLDQISDAYVQYSIQLRQTSLRQGVQFVQEQLPELEKRVNQLQRDLEKFRQRYSIVDPQSRGDQLSNLISSIEKQQQETQTQLSEAKALYSTLQEQARYRSPSQAISASSLSESPRYQALLNQMQQIETQIATESTRFKTESPNMQALLDRRQALLPLLSQEAERILGTRTPGVTGNLSGIAVDLNKQLVNTANQIETLQMRDRALADAQNRFKKEFALVPSLARQYADLQRQLKIATESLERFLSTRENLQIEAAQRAIPWQLLTNPTQPTFPISPNVPRNLLLGAIAGLLLGIGAALLTEKLDNVFHSANDLKDSTKLPILGIIPFRRELKEIAGTPAAVSPLPAAENSTNLGDELLEQSRSQRSAAYRSSPFLDSFRTLHTNIRFLSSDEPIRSLVIGSAVPADGKSTVAVHLAQAAAAMGQRVLLVDADMRRPQVHSITGLPNLRGLSNIISTDLDPATVIQPSPYDENLFLLCAGQIPPDPTKLLSSNKMQHLVEQFEKEYDLVVFDTPPLLGLADSNLLSTYTDGIILVVGLGRTDRSALTQALDGLKLSSTTVLGMVANGVKGYTDDYYQSYYNRYYSRETQKATLPDEA